VRGSSGKSGFRKQLAYHSVGLRAKFTSDIEELAQWCERNDLADEAKKTRHIIPPHDPYKLYLPILPEQVGSTSLSSVRRRRPRSGTSVSVGCGAIMRQPSTTSRESGASRPISPRF